MSLNPYSPPISQGPPDAQVDFDGDGVVTPRIMAAMGQTRPWVTLLSVFTFIGAGLMVLAAIAMLFRAPMGAPFSGPLLGLVYLLPAVLYGVAGTLLFRYRSAIVALQSGLGVEALEDAVEHQKSFWRFAGITAAASSAFYLLVVIAVTVYAVFMAM